MIKSHNSIIRNIKYKNTKFGLFSFIVDRSGNLIDNETADVRKFGRQRTKRDGRNVGLRSPPVLTGRNEHNTKYV